MYAFVETGSVLHVAWNVINNKACSTCYFKAALKL